MPILICIFCKPILIKYHFGTHMVVYMVAYMLDATLSVIPPPPSPQFRIWHSSRKMINTFLCLFVKTQIRLSFDLEINMYEWP